MYFKYTVDKGEPFRMVNLRRRKAKGRLMNLSNICVSIFYNGLLGINPLKKKDLLSIIDLIDRHCHDFYYHLPVKTTPKEFDELEDNVQLDDDE